MIEEKDYSKIDSLLQVMARLRNPDGGCPWDLEQNFRSIAPFTLEEAYEVVDAIERDDMAHLEDELGDLLLQVVFHAQMAKEAGEFEFGHVVAGIVAKMIRRHPHVFADEVHETPGDVLTRWDEIKAAEKAARGDAGGSSPLDDIPANLPGLMQAQKLQKKAHKNSMPQAGADETLGQLGELLKADQWQGDASSEMVGDLLFACVNLARQFDVDADAALREANQRFRDQYAAATSHADT